MNEEMLKDYKRHPRILELKFVRMFNRLRLEFPYNTVVSIIKSLSEIFGCNWTSIKGIIDNLFEIDRVRKKDWVRHRQEIIFMGYLEGKTNYEISKELGINPSNLYSKKYPYRVKDFLNQEWLDKLDDSVVICWIPQYKSELITLLEHMESLKGAI